MRNALRFKKLLVVVGCVFALLLVPPLFVGAVRRWMVGLCAPLWTAASRVGRQENVESRQELENHLLRLEINRLKACLDQVISQGVWEAQSVGDPLHREQSEALLSRACTLVPAQVIHRDPSHWSSVCWIDVGSAINVHFPRPVVCKNSPVLVGRSLVGVVEEVELHRARVRLITDGRLKPAVRAVRGFVQRIFLAEHIGFLVDHLKAQQDLPLADKTRASLLVTLEALLRDLQQEEGGWYLAKGVLQGSSAPLWRKCRNRLRGYGFNYDFSDDEGDARELSSGGVLGGEGEAVPLLKEGDLLVTTGMDGVFPPGLLVAEVDRVFPLEEGAYTYDLEARPTAGNLDHLHTVFVLPPEDSQ